MKDSFERAYMFEDVGLYKVVVRLNNISPNQLSSEFLRFQKSQCPCAKTCPLVAGASRRGQTPSR